MFCTMLSLLTFRSSHTYRTFRRHYATGEEGVPVAFAGLEFRPGQYVYADEDGIVLSNEPLQVPKPADSL